MYGRQSGGNIKGSV